MDQTPYPPAPRLFPYSPKNTPLTHIFKGVYLAWTEMMCPQQYPAVIELSPPIISLKNKKKQSVKVSFT